MAKRRVPPNVDDWMSAGSSAIGVLFLEQRRIDEASIGTRKIPAILPLPEAAAGIVFLDKLSFSPAMREFLSDGDSILLVDSVSRAWRGRRSTPLIRS
ncbi:hypothetical protein M6B38_384775 [Iris pallida]|uniref:Uncharacterized protein n=1 Tax=Iris pallida TaxID=29817 RepID=A0AAX6G3J1_IRIPA|nr:hypothetical protein M6B38_204975 [Iris pallida]KAJ6823200.1 hypothetical protein M6B38_384775 [Iris pallida]